PPDFVLMSSRVAAGQVCRGAAAARSRALRPHPQRLASQNRARPMSEYLPTLLSDAEALCVASFEDETQPWARKIGCDLALLGLRSPVEQHMLDAHMVVEPFEVEQPRRRTSSM